jgi:hypothetical protein
VRFTYIFAEKFTKKSINPHSYMNIIWKLLTVCFLFTLQIGTAQSKVRKKPAKKKTYVKPQPKVLTHQDIFNAKMQMPRPLSMAQGVLAFGTTFIGNPYPKSNIDTTKKTATGQVVLQPIDQEVLVVNLKKFDCVTFVESMVALTQTRRDTFGNYDIFKQNLTNVRYRNGAVDYASRLHYFSDWLYENEKTGTLRNITKEIGGEIFNKPVFYMSLKRDTFYGNMADPQTYSTMKSVEEAITKRPKWYVPKGKVAAIESKLKDGDIIGITNALDGMDMAHAGILKWQNGRAYLVHASSQFHQVMISDVPLVDYLLRNKAQTGIMVGRLKG